jgi:DNA-nicking Smr family endonuclease
LKRGKHRIEARLDLHGMTQIEAHRALLWFIRMARADGKRCVLVITGRGSPTGPNGGGVLKAAVPRWFEEPEFRPHLLAISPAQPRDGGAGALYVMLRRNATMTER